MKFKVPENAHYIRLLYSLYPRSSQIAKKAFIESIFAYFCPEIDNNEIE